MERGRNYGVPVYIIAGILVLGLVKVAEALFVPLALSLFSIALVWPLQASLQRFVPKLLAMLVSLLVMVIVILTVASAVAWGFGKLIQWLFCQRIRTAGNLCRVDRMA